MNLRIYEWGPHYLHRSTKSRWRQRWKEIEFCRLFFYVVFPPEHATARQYISLLCAPFPETGTFLLVLSLHCEALFSPNKFYENLISSFCPMQRRFSQIYLHLVKLSEHLKKHLLPIPLDMCISLRVSQVTLNQLTHNGTCYHRLQIWFSH